MSHLNMWQVTAVVLMMTVASIFAAIPGPNDPRYPDYIVNPPVSCTQEGSFPHPRNCSWFYRCVDRMKVGYFWTYHFECEPGTVFLDELDQCVHPFVANYDCKSPTTDKPSLTCEGVPGTCTTYDVCRPTKTKKLMCTEIQCPLRTPNLRCGDGYAFDMETHECASIPTATELCLLTCEGVPGTCKTYEVCRPEKDMLYLCKEIRCPLRQLSCREGYFYDMKNQTCVLPPNRFDLCGVNISVTDMGLVGCAYNGQRPKEDFVVRTFCKDIPLCNGNSYTKTIQLCKGFYECEKTAKGWIVHKRSCPEGFLYSFDLGKCDLIPTAEERCKNFK